MVGKNVLLLTSSIYCTFRSRIKSVIVTNKEARKSPIHFDTVSRLVGYSLCRKVRVKNQQHPPPLFFIAQIISGKCIIASGWKLAQLCLLKLINISCLQKCKSVSRLFFHRVTYQTLYREHSGIRKKNQKKG